MKYDSFKKAKNMQSYEVTPLSWSLGWPLDQVTHNWQNDTKYTNQANISSHTLAEHLAVHIFCYLLGNVEVSTGGSGVKGDPALIVGLVDAGPVFHQEGHHVHIIIYAGLETRR